MIPTPPAAPTSVPANPPQPSTAEYPATALQTVAEYPNAQAYEAAFGQPPPKLDLSNGRPLSFFFDSSATGFVYSYFYIGKDANGNPVILTMEVPTSWIKTPNIPLDTDTVPQTAQTLPMPVRALITGTSAETLYVAQDAGGPGISELMVQRADMQQSVAVAFTAPMASLLSTMAAQVAAIKAKLGA